LPAQNRPKKQWQLFAAMFLLESNARLKKNQLWRKAGFQSYQRKLR
jgi:hypothetical protein